MVHQLCRWASALIFALLITTVAAPLPVAAGDPLNGAELQSRTYFGDEIVFKLTVPWDGPKPQAVEARFGLPDGAVTKRGAADFNINNGTLSATHRWRPRGTLVPGAEVQFEFVIMSTNGEQSSSPSSTLTYIDTDLPWKHVQEGPVEIWYYAGGEQLEIDARKGVRLSMAVLQEQFSITIQRPTRLLLYGDIERMRQDLGGGTSPWSAGAAIAEFNVTVLHASPDPHFRRDLKAVIAHELTHIAIEHVTDNPFGGVPLWVHEGLATTVESAVFQRFPYQQIMADAVEQGEFVSLRGLTGAFPANNRRAIQAYAQSNSLIQYITTRWGTDAIKRILDAYAMGVTDDDAIQEALSLTLEDLERAWLIANGANNPRLVGFISDPDKQNGAVSANTDTKSESPSIQSNHLRPLLTAALAGSIGITALTVSIARRLRHTTTL